MKTRLLRKVRNRFSIIKVIERPSDPKHFINQNIKSIKVPFFYLTDKKDVLNLKMRVSKNYETLRLDLLNIIRNEYTHVVKKNNGKITKVWW